MDTRSRNSILILAISPLSKSQVTNSGDKTTFRLLALSLRDRNSSEYMTRVLAESKQYTSGTSLSPSKV